MAQITNNSGRPVNLLRWTILPDGSYRDVRGNVQEVLPDNVMYSSQARQLADQGVITVEGYIPQPVEIPVAPVVLPVVEEVKIPEPVIVEVPVVQPEEKPVEETSTEVMSAEGTSRKRRRLVE